MFNNSLLFFSPAKNSTGSKPHGKPSSQTIAVWYVTIMILCVIGAVNNLLLLTVIFKTRKLRAGAGILVAHLIVIFSVMCTFLYPISNTVIFMQAYNIRVSDTFCRAIQGPAGACVIVANWTDVFLALNRFMAICLPHHYARWAQKKVSIALISVAWFFAALCTGLAALFKIGGEYVATEMGICYFKGHGAFGDAQYFLGASVPNALVGVAAVAVLAKLLLAELRKKRRIAANWLLARVYYATPRARRRLGVAKMLFASFLFCFVCSLPVAVVTINQHLVRDSMWALWFRFLYVGPYALNPVRRNV